MEKSFVSKVFLVVLIGVLILLLRLFWAYISAIILALLIASAFYPLYAWLKKLLKGEERGASMLMTIFIFLVLVIPVGGFVGTLSNEAFDFYRRSREAVSLLKIQQIVEGDSIWAQRIRKVGELTGIEVNSETIEALATELGRNVGLFLSKQLRSMASNLLNFLIHFFLMMLIVYYVFRDGERLKNYISELLPFPMEQQELVVSKFREMARAVIVGNGLNGIIQGIIGGFGFFFFGLGSPFLWGTLIGFMAFLPFIGASIVYVPAFIILILQGKTGTAIGFLFYNGAYSIIMEYLFKPRMIGKGMRMNALLVFIGILGGIKLFGILGIIYGPLIMTIFITLAELYRLEYKEAMV
ncbi:MAG: AI-2E family transporter [Desulfobacteraceae bacterium]|jgi:predicted PurR-regulated permease PerM